MKIIFLSSAGCACGISVYTEDVAQALQRRGNQTWIINSMAPWDQVVQACKTLVQEQHADVLHIQYELVISGPWERLADLVHILKRFNPNLGVFVTLHRTGDDTVAGAMSLGSNVQIITSADHTFNHLPNVHIAPMGCPVFPERDKLQIRREIGVPEDAILLSTFGFLSPWKRHDEVAQYLFPRIASDPRIWVQFMCAPNSFAPHAEQHQMAVKIHEAAIAHGVRDRAILIHNWLPRDEVNRRLQASDVGFLFAGMHTGSSSAANKDCISARLPLVTTDSNHHWDIRKGVLRSAGTDLLQFPIYVMKLVGDADLRARLQQEMRELYAEQNWDTVIEKHLELYRKVPVAA